MVMSNGNFIGDKILATK